MYRLLIVDDEPEVVEWLYDLFAESKRPDLEICRAFSAREALVLFARHQIDVLISDIKMPGITGLQLMDTVKNNWPECRIIFLTGFSEFEYVYYAIQQQGVRYLLKTEDDGKIIAAVNNAISDMEKSSMQNKALQNPSTHDNPPSTCVKAEKNEADIITNLKQYIHLHLDQELSLTRLADMVFFNPSYLSRRFKQLTGMKLTEYIQKARIEKARELLEQKNRKVNEICSQLGYESPQSFARSFKNVTGISPQEYRESFVIGKGMLQK